MEKQDLDYILSNLSLEGQRTLILELVNKHLTHDPTHLKIAAEHWARNRRLNLAMLCVKPLQDKKFEATLYELGGQFENAARIYAELHEYDQAVMTYLKSNSPTSKKEAIELAERINDQDLLIYIYTKDPIKTSEAVALLEKKGEYDMLLKFYEEKAHYHSAHTKAKELFEHYKGIDAEKSHKYELKANTYKKLLAFTSPGDKLP